MAYDGPIGHVLVVGAGLAGVTTCAALRASGFEGRLTLVGAEPGAPYDRPPLSKGFLAGEADDQAILLQPEAWYAEQKIDLRTGVPVASIDIRESTAAGSDIEADFKAVRAELADGTALTADVLVLATGGTARRIPGFDHSHPAVHVLRTRDDSTRLRLALRPGTRLLVIGAGLIGAEASATARKLGCGVTLVDPTAVPLANVLGQPAAETLHHQHSRNGVRTVHASCPKLESDGADRPLRATLSTGETVLADQVLVGVGIVPDTALAQRAGLDVDNGVLVDEGLRTSSPHVYAVGDIARVVGPDGPRPRVEHWDNARRTAETAARSILGLPALPPKTPWFWTDRYDTHLEMAGHYDPLAEQIVRGDLGADGGTVLFLRDGRCVGAVSVDRPLDIRAVQRIIDRGLKPAAEQLADESVPLRDLLK